MFLKTCSERVALTLPQTDYIQPVKGSSVFLSIGFKVFLHDRKQPIGTYEAFDKGGMYVSLLIIMCLN